MDLIGIQIGRGVVFEELRIIARAIFEPPHAIIGSRHRLLALHFCDQFGIGRLYRCQQRVRCLLQQRGLVRIG